MELDAVGLERLVELVIKLLDDSRTGLLLRSRQVRRHLKGAPFKA
jgi:hypothetical protein